MSLSQLKLLGIYQRELSKNHGCAGAALQAVAEAAVKDAGEAQWVASGGDYDRAIHRNPDARAWADLFMATFPQCGADRDTLFGWFANAMMAMHDSRPQASATVPDGMVLVPVEPTEAMCEAALWASLNSKTGREIVAAAIAASQPEVKS